MEVDISSDESDEEQQLEEIRQLNEVIQLDELASETGSRYSSSVAGTSTVLSSRYQEYANIESAIQLNKLYHEKLKRLGSIFQYRLRECRQKLAELNGQYSLANREKQKQGFRYINCGKPYFRDKSNFPAPDNEDAQVMAKTGMYDFSLVTAVPGWTVRDKSEFVATILTMSKEMKKAQIQSEIAQLHRDIKGLQQPEAKPLQAKINALQKQIRAVESKTLNQLALPLDKEYDWDAIANKLNHRHSALEYRALWHMFLHPAVSKNSWTKEEHVALHKIAVEHNLQDWDAIAKQLNTGRSGYQCFVYYRTNMTNSSHSQLWTKEEEEYLKRLIDYYKEDQYIPWGKVAASMENRTKIQIYNKYFRITEQRKGRFSTEEDSVILTAVRNFGANFKYISQYLPGRSTTQLRTRYNILTKRKRTSVLWSVEEDKKLVQIMANQDSVVNYCDLCKHFPGKDRVHIRSRYLTLSKWMKRHPNTNIERAPRRGSRRLGHGCAAGDLNEALEKLKNKIKCEVESKKPGKKITIDSPEVVIEDAIMATILNETIKLEEQNRAEIQEAEQNALRESLIVEPEATANERNLQNILLLLRAKLDKNAFLESHYPEKYPGLVKLDTNLCTFNFKSYSKKDILKTVSVPKDPTIWGEHTLNSSDYVLPPHYATITGCRRLISHVSVYSRKDPNTLSLRPLMRRNVIFKEQIDRLMERFNILFVWPMMLSTVMPGLNRSLVPIQSHKEYEDYPHSSESWVAKTETPAVPAISYRNHRAGRAKRVTKEDIVIDLNQSEDDQQIEVYVGNDDFQYLPVTQSKSRARRVGLTFLPGNKRLITSSSSNLESSKEKRLPTSIS